MNDFTAAVVSVNGRITSGDKAVVSVFDRGFLYGDSVYESMRTANCEAVDLDAHLERLERSAASIALTLPTRAELMDAVTSTLSRAEGESAIRVVVTRGTAVPGLDTDLAVHPTVIVIVRPLELPLTELYERGAVLAVVGVQRIPRRAMDPGVKSGNYLNNIMALVEARKLGAYEAVMCDAEGRVAEGSTSNLFIVRNDELCTPPLEVGLLPGITRWRVLELAKRAGIATRECNLMPEDLYVADELFITSSIRGVMPVREVSGHMLRVPVPGPMTARLMALYGSSLTD